MKKSIFLLLFCIVWTESLKSSSDFFINEKRVQSRVSCTMMADAGIPQEIIDQVRDNPTHFQRIKILRVPTPTESEIEVRLLELKSSVGNLDLSEFDARPNKEQTLEEWITEESETPRLEYVFKISWKSNR